MSDYTELVKTLRELSVKNSLSFWKRGVCKDAAAAIEELQAKISELGESYSANLVAAQNAQPHWVSVEEPPRDGQECIVAYLGPTDWIYEHATYHSDLNNALEEDIFIEGTDGFIVDGDVGYARHSFNYWMPIEPPKEVQNADYPTDNTP